jgi:glycosyltransferase involved in cell wall biosynthesis
MNILHTVKFYYPSNGGMESVVKNIVEGISAVMPDYHFNVYANNHTPSFVRRALATNNINVIKERTPVLFKSQPLNVLYPLLNKLIRDNDIIHHHYPFPNVEIALYKNRHLLKNKKLIVTWHANIKNSRWKWIQKYYDPLTIKLLELADEVVITSPQLLESSLLLQKYEQKVSVIPLSFDPLFDLEGNTAKSLPSNRRSKVLFVGKLRKYKGVKYLIDAISGLPVDLVIVGDGEEEKALKLQVAALNIQEQVSFYSNLSNAQLAEIYKQADLFVLPSINEAEAFGVVQLEAMANGLPVINTQLNSGVPFVSLNGITGSTVAPMDVAGLAQAISQITGDANLYEQYSTNAIERVKKFTRENMAASYLKLYQS